MSSKIALISGVSGQDGSYLTELLLEKGYKVHGIIRRSSSFNTDRIDHVFDDKNLTLHYGDLTDAGNITNLIAKIRPHEIYHLGAQSHVKVSFDVPAYTVDTIAMGTLNILEAVRHIDRKIKVYYAGSSEQFGSTPPPQNENTVFSPRSPYACAKVFGYQLGNNYRDAYDMFICNGILFNHEGPRRGETFVTRKITRAATRIKLGLQDKLVLGNLKAKRDWGHAKDYCRAMWMMLQHPTSDNYVVSAGCQYSVEQFLQKVFNILELEIDEHVVIDPKYFRPTEVNSLLGDSSKIRMKLGWKPEYSFDDLVLEMVDEDMKTARNELILTNA